MSGSVDTIIAEAVQLPPDQRLALANRILMSVEPEISADVDAAWDFEIRERITRYDAGGTRSVPASEVFAEVDRRLRR
jgi:putative addiction module component (TIGR02574 family)